MPGDRRSPLVPAGSPGHMAAPGVGSPGDSRTSGSLPSGLVQPQVFSSRSPPRLSTGRGVRRGSPAAACDAERAPGTGPWGDRMTSSTAGNVTHAHHDYGGTMSTQAVERLDVGEFWSKGYAVLPHVFSRAEIQQFRQAAYATKDFGGDLLANPELSSVLTDGRLAAVARRLLDIDLVYYGGDSSFTINGTQKGFHKDNT